MDDFPVDEFPVDDPRSDGPRSDDSPAEGSQVSVPPGAGGPTALPGVGARAVAFAAILVSGLCGLLIGSSLVTLLCRGSCAVSAGLGGLVGAILSAGGVAVVSVLVLRAMGEWRARPAGTRPPGGQV